MTEKREVAELFLTPAFAFSLFLLVIFSLGSAEAALGLTPALVDINFEPNLNISAKFSVLGASPEQKIEIYAKGDLANYVKFDKNETLGGGEFTVFLNLPNYIEKPGKNLLYIGAIEKLDEEEGGIGVRLGVQALIVVRVPYPGKYAEMNFFMQDINENEPLKLEVEVDNLGTESITASTIIVIYSGENEVKSVDLGAKFIETKTKSKFEKTIDTSDMNSGLYKAIAMVNYGITIKEEKEFRIGTMLINITNWTSEFAKGKINKFFVEIESLWNSRIENVYAAVNITSGNASIDYFKTPSISLEPWKKEVLEGFFNAENVKSNEYNINITLFYNDKTTSRMSEIFEIKDDKEYSNLIIAISAAAIAVLILIIVLFILKNGKNKKARK